MTIPRIIIDTDPAMGSKGGDPEDSFAIMLALNSPEVEVVGVTVVQGNVPVERGYSNAVYLLEAMGRDIPVHAGPPNCLRPARTAQRRGLSERDIEQINPLLDPSRNPVSAADFIAKMCMGEPGEIELVTIGPLTNVAIALEQHPGLAAAIPRITMMAGAAKIPGNITPAAEFNVWADPDAADVVVRSGIPMVMVPLDVCHQTRMDRNALARIGENPHPLAQFVQEAVEPWIEVRAQSGGGEGFHLYDSLAMAAAFAPDIIGCRPAYVAVETQGRYTTGETVCEFNESVIGRLRNKSANAEVALTVDIDAFNALFEERVIAFLRNL